MEPSTRRCCPRWVKIGLLVAVLAGVVGYLVYANLLRQEPQHFDTPEDVFKYGSIGTEAEEGLPYWVWMVLPRIFRDKLPGNGGYESFGVVWEEGHETPVGFSKKTIGFPRIGINCALCHTGTYRTESHQQPIVVVAGPANRLDALGYQRFLFACASDDRFNADVILPVIEYNIKLSPIEKAFYRYLIIPQTRKALLKAKERFAWTDSRPDWGRGRIDPFNPVKFHPDLLGLDPKTDPSIGNSDMEPLWKMAGRENASLHWDGLNNSLTEVVLSGAIGDGARPKSLPVQGLKELENWIKNVQPPKYPCRIDWMLAAKGEPIFQQNCASCHSPGGKRFGQVIPLSEVKTDGHRLGMWSQEAADRYNDYGANYPWHFSHFVRTDGYVAVPLFGLWLRAPYLHNGSVPTLEDLLQPAAERPPKFYRGYDVYDSKHVGFEQPPQDADKSLYFEYKTGVEGNSNQGHEGKLRNGESFGTDLSTNDKRALIEYLKTL